MNLINLVWNEIIKEFHNTYYFKWQWIGEFITLIIFYNFLSFLAKESVNSITYGIWFYSVLIIGDISGKISIEMRTGTLEQIYLSSFSTITLFLAKIIASILRAMLIVIIFLSIFWSLGYANFSSINFNILLFSLGITPSLLGISLFMGGLTVVQKDVSWLMNILNNGFLFLSGIFIPIENFSLKIQMISLTSPVTLAVRAVQENQNLFTYFENVIVINLIYFILGIVFFLFSEKKAQKNGVLEYY